jgi:carbonic anhydrase
MKKLVAGLRRFQTEVFPQKQQLFKRLADSQNPDALFITCADSRVMPELITQAAPGDIFICRNAGNIIPPYGEMNGGVSATIEYAVMVLRVRNIIVCGHSDCGALRAVQHPERVANLPTISSWLKHAESARMVVEENYPGLSHEEHLELLIRANVVAQIDHLRTHPSVASRVARGDLNLYGWVYSIETGEVISYDNESGTFLTLSEDCIPAATPRPRILAGSRDR